MELTKRKTLSGTRFLSFVLNNEEYCIEILKIKEIMGMTLITPIPQTPDFIKGVINLRGQIIPIIDLRLKFQMQFKDYSKRTSIIIVELLYENERTLMGIAVDTIKEVVGIPEEKITKIPYINAKIKTEYIKGVAEVGNSIKIILDISRALTEEDFILIKGLDNQKKEKELKGGLA
jgi:purine-binding chemotaxis protein CheW